MRRRTVIAAVGTAALALAGTGAIVAAHAAAASVSRGWYGAAAYVMPFENSPPDLPSVMAATGQKTFELAFVLSGGGCSPAWDGIHDINSDTTASSVINSIRNAGGDITVSFGGYGGTKLGETCADPQSTANAYQAVINKYGLKAVDFDLEEPEYEKAAAIHNEIGAAKILRQNNSGLYVSITTAGTTGGEGTGYFGKQLLLEAKNSGFTPDNYSIMPFDGGFGGGSAQTAALDGFHTTLMNTFGWDSATAYSHEGVSLMNGRSDTGEFFKQADFQTVLNYVTSHGLTRYTYWSVNRDRQCSPPDNNGTTSGTCSSVPQSAWEFTKFTAKFGGAVPPTVNPTTGGPTPTQTGGTGGTCTAPPWNPATAYNGGAVVSFNGHQYTAKWWSQGHEPDHYSGPDDEWRDNGACSGGPPTSTPSPTPAGSPSPTVSPTGGGQYASWQPNHAYAVGDLVSYGGHNYRCIQAHTSLVGWEPPNVPALWQALN
jgi:chitinase